MKNVLIVAFILLFNVTFAQKHIKGFVFEEVDTCNSKDKVDSGIKPLAYSTIYLIEDTLRKPNRRNISTISDFNGFFEFTSVDDKYKYVLINAPFYNPKYIKIKQFESGTIRIVMEMKEQRSVTLEKPVIYLYPQKKCNIDLKILFKGIIKTTYPEYNGGWKIIADSTGLLEDRGNHKIYKSLFWDGICSFDKKHFEYKDGFVVEKKDLIGFLENSLSEIGLNTFEINDFIVYWLPKLNENEYNLIHFWINDNYDNSTILEINPKPETLIRVYMEFKKASPNYIIKEQILPQIKRKGFVVIEWGGSEIENDIL